VRDNIEAVVTKLGLLLTVYKNDTQVFRSLYNVFCVQPNSDLWTECDIGKHLGV